MQTHSIGSFILRRKQSTPALPGGPNKKLMTHAGQPFPPDAPVENVSLFSPEAEVEIPSFVLVDQDSGIVKVLNEAQINVKDLDLLLHKEKGIRFWEYTGMESVLY